MRRLSILLLLCGCGVDATPRSETEAADARLPDAAPIDATPHFRAPVPAIPAPGMGCERDGEVGCFDDHVLVCRAGYGGARWLDKGACESGQVCTDGLGCALLPECAADGQRACTGADEVECRDGRWRHARRCVADLTCIHGRGCPDFEPVGKRCSGEEPLRCAAGHMQACVESLDGMYMAMWEDPIDCLDFECEAGRGCAWGACDRPGQRLCLNNNAHLRCVRTGPETSVWKMTRCPCNNGACLQP